MLGCFYPFLIFMIILIVVFAAIYPNAELAMDPGETRLVTDYSPSFVKEISFYQMDNSVDIYHLDKVPSLEGVPTGKANYKDKETIDLSEEEYVNFSHWLNKGSTIDL